MKSAVVIAYDEYVSRCEAAGAEFCDFDRFRREWREVQRIERNETKLDHRQIARERRSYTWINPIEAPIRSINQQEEESYD